MAYTVWGQRYKSKLARIWLLVVFKKIPLIRKPAETKPSFRKVSLHPAKLHILFSTQFVLESFVHESTLSDRP